MQVLRRRRLAGKDPVFEVELGSREDVDVACRRISGVRGALASRLHQENNLANSERLGRALRAGSYRRCSLQWNQAMRARGVGLLRGSALDGHIKRHYGMRCYVSLVRYRVYAQSVRMSPDHSLLAWLSVRRFAWGSTRCGCSRRRLHRRTVGTGIQRFKLGGQERVTISRFPRQYQALHRSIPIQRKGNVHVCVIHSFFAYALALGPAAYPHAQREATLARTATSSAAAADPLAVALTRRTATRATAGTRGTAAVGEATATGGSTPLRRHATAACPPTAASRGVCTDASPLFCWAYMVTPWLCGYSMYVVAGCSEYCSRCSQCKC